MAVRESYREFVVEQLSRVEPVRWKRMFGGIGLYAQDLFFALIDNDTLYFKTGEGNRADFEKRGMPAFQPFGPDSQPMGYHQLPAEILEDVTQLTQWMPLALAEARRPKGKTKTTAKPKKKETRNPSSAKLKKTS